MRGRVIPCLTIKGEGLVKTVKFSDPKYIGDPVNAVKIFNEKEVDEIVLLDIDTGMHGGKPNLKLIGKIASEAFIPLSYGGGISSVRDAEEVFSLGIEKIILNTAILDSYDLITELAMRYGSQSVVAAVNIKKNLFGSWKLYSHKNKKNSTISLDEYLSKIESSGVGEVFLNSVDNDGVMQGYDIELVKFAVKHTSVPIIASGGAAGMHDFKCAIESGASGAAAGSAFVFHGKHRAVLIQYPTQSDLNNLLKD